METATTHLLTALYSLSHRIALTAEDVAELDRDWPCLTPELWKATRELLGEADRGAAGTTLDIGFMRVVLRWLGLADEDAFAAEFGVGVVEALGRDLGCLAEIAGAIERPRVPGAEALGVQLTLAWSRRGWDSCRRAPGRPPPPWRRLHVRSCITPAWMTRNTVSSSSRW